MQGLVLDLMNAINKRSHSLNECLPHHGFSHVETLYRLPVADPSEGQNWNPHTELGDF